VQGFKNERIEEEEAALAATHCNTHCATRTATYTATHTTTHAATYTATHTASHIACARTSQPVNLSPGARFQEETHRRGGSRAGCAAGLGCLRAIDLQPAQVHFV